MRTRIVSPISKLRPKRIEKLPKRFVMISLPANASITQPIHAHARSQLVSMESSSKIKNIQITQTAQINIIRTIGRKRLTKILSIAQECRISLNIRLIMLEIRAIMVRFLVIIYDPSIILKVSALREKILQKFLYAITIKERRILQVSILNI